jgi:hypothetical protein
MVGLEVEARIRAELASGKGIHKVARMVGVRSGTVHRVKAEMRACEASQSGCTWSPDADGGESPYGSK